MSRSCRKEKTGRRGRERYARQPTRTCLHLGEISEKNIASDSLNKYDIKLVNEGKFKRKKFIYFYGCIFEKKSIMTKVSSFSIDRILGNDRRHETSGHLPLNVRPVTSHRHEGANVEDVEHRLRSNNHLSQQNSHVFAAKVLRQSHGARTPNKDAHLNASSHNCDVTDSNDVTDKRGNPVRQQVPFSLPPPTPQPLVTSQSDSIDQTLDESQLQSNPLLRHPLADPSTLLNTLYPGLDQFVAMSAALRPGLQHFPSSYPSLAASGLHRLGLVSFNSRPEFVLPYDRTAALRCKSQMPY